MKRRSITILFSLGIISIFSLCCLNTADAKINTNISTLSEDTSIKMDSKETNSEDSCNGYKGKLSDMPDEYMTDSIKEYMDENPELVDTAEIAIMNEDALTSYTYKNAPENLRLEYEQNCESIGKTPCDDDPIIVQNK